MGTNRAIDLAERRKQMRMMLSEEGRQRIRHCWVEPEPRFADEDSPAPGLVIAWARSGGTWMARVVHLWEHSVVIQAWYPCDRLIPIETPLPFRRSRH